MPSRTIAIETANVPSIYGRGDPGDCFLIATAHVRKFPIVTRDAAMADLALRRPDYLRVITC
jgi:PIN domain nuclease of toxin-antitoxin system